jgi:hypothetical protein
MKKIAVFLVLSGLLLGLPACAVSNAQSTLTTMQVGSAVDQSPGVTGLTTTTSASFSAEDVDSNMIGEISASITLNGDSISVDGSGVTVAGNVATITTAGTYRINGTLHNGQLLVDSTAEEKITLLLDGVDITSTTSAPLYVVNAAKVVVELVQGSVNTLTDGANYVFADPEKEEPNATLFSNDDLTIKGTGSLTINANYNNGIASDDDLKITGGNITVNAVHDGIQGKSSVSIKDATITVNAGGDGIQSTNAEDTEKGTVTIAGGTLYITSALDGIQAASNLTISAADVHIVAGGGSVNGISHTENWNARGGQNMQPGNPAQEDESDSMKGLKAGTLILISGGTISIDSADDTLNSDDNILIEDGTLDLISGDDGLHANTAITINGGVLDISQSYEGIESALITINGGNLHIIASDDGINVAGGNDGSAINGRPGQGQFTANSNYFLYINDGYMYVNADGDGLDSNGSIEMNGGTVLVNGPTNNGNGALDYMGTFNINAGFLVAVGSSGMAQASSTTSTQYSAMVNFTSMAPAGSLIHFETAAGDPILTFVPAKEFQSILISTPDITNGSTLLLYYGGTSTGNLQDGLYTGGTYTPGTQVTNLDVTSVVTGAGSGGGMLPGGGGRGR